MTILLPKIIEYLEEHDSISATWLFGSAATGKLKEESDIDIAVLFVSDLSKQKRFDLRLKLAGEMTRAAGRTVDVEDIQAVPLYFQYQIRKEGSLIVEKDHHYRIIL